MTYISDHSDEKFTHRHFGPVDGESAQKARRHDEVLGDPSQKVRDPREAANVSVTMKEYVNAAVDAIAGVMKGDHVRADIRAAVEGVLSRSHGLFEGGSGTGKTLLCVLLSEVLNFPYERIDGQADLSDVQIIGAEFPLEGNFYLRRGLLLQPAIFVQVDEFGRITATAGNSMLQAYEEREVMVGTLRGSGQSRVKLSPAFVTINTKNFDSYLGSSGCNEAWLDRMGYGRRMSMPDHKGFVDLCKNSQFSRDPLTPIPLPTTLYKIWSAIEYVQVSDPIANAIVNANYYVSPPDYCAGSGWNGCSFEPTRRRKGIISDLARNTSQFLAEGSNPRGVKFTCLRAKANAFFRGSMQVDLIDVRRAAQEALLFRLKPYPGTTPAVVSDIITKALDLCLPV